MANESDDKTVDGVLKNSMPVQSLPAWTGGRPAGLPLYHSGGNRARARLRTLNFDPIDMLVKRHKELENELEMQEQMKDGKAVRLRQDGKPKAFVFEQYLGVQRELISISEKLMRYKYGRVPEVETPKAQAKPMMLVRLNKKGDVFTLNAGEEAEPDFDEEDIDD
jgi:hypothetical protein